MTTARTFGWLLGAVTALLVAACGGGGGGGGSDEDATGGIDRGGVTIAQGTINGFGSVIVNGVHYSTGSATITVDDQPGTESDLRVGQVVRVEGTVDAGGTTGTARSISYDDDVEGPVQSIDLATARFVVLGQTVQVGAGTSFDDSIVPRSLDGLQVGDRVEVSGLVGSDGMIAATRVELRTGTAPVEVKGAVASVDTAARRFSINQLQVDYAAATLTGFATGQPANGDLVEAQGALNGSGVLVATSVERRSASLSGTTDDEADLEGLITRYVSATDFDVAGQRVTTTGATRYEGGTAANLALNVAVEVEGGFDATGRIVATEVEFRPQGDVELSGPVDSISLATSSLVLLGITVRTTTLTRFEDQSSADVERFDLADLAVGDQVEIRAYDDGSGLVATLLERDDPEAGVELQGIATDVAQPNFRVAGVAITTDLQTEYRDNNGASISAATFFAAAPGREVKVSGSRVGDTVLADRAELED
jgi:hypothetical protein